MAILHFYIDFPFSGLSPLSGKILGTPPQVTQFLEGPTPSFPLIKGGGVPKFQLWSMCRGVSLEVYTLCS